MVLVLLRQGGPAGSGAVTSTYTKRMAAMDLQELVRDAVTNADCPWCHRHQRWWMPGGDRNNFGLVCFDGECGFRLDLPPGPPAILCSRCGNQLQRDGGCYRCRCGREVRPVVTTKTAT